MKSHNNHIDGDVRVRGGAEREECLRVNVVKNLVMNKMEAGKIETGERCGKHNKFNEFELYFIEHYCYVIRARAHVH